MAKLAVEAGVKLMAEQPLQHTEIRIHARLITPENAAEVLESGVGELGLKNEAYFLGAIN